jgi:thiamine pyrophosphokinase
LLILSPRMSGRSFSIASSLNSNNVNIKILVKNLKLLKDNANFLHGVFSNQCETLHNKQIKYEIKNTKFKVVD